MISSIHVHILTSWSYLGKRGPIEHPYWYARVLGIYHTEAWLDTGSSIERHQIEALYVRWLAPLTDHKSGMNYARLPKVAFVEEGDRDAFGFLDPGQVIRSAHLIPAFTSGRGTTSLRQGESFARQGGEVDDWEAYYVGMYVQFPIQFSLLEQSTAQIC
jgi:hypothetical protein